MSQDEDDISRDPELFYVSCLALFKQVDSKTLLSRVRYMEVQGLVLRRLEEGDNAPDVFHRVGFFTTS